MRRAALVTGGVLLAAVGVAVTAAVWLWTRDPLDALPRADPDALTVVEEWREPSEGRMVLHVALAGGGIGRARFIVSLPAPGRGAPLPVVVVLGGLRGGADSIRELTAVRGDPGPNAILGYDWPLPTREPRVAEIVLSFRSLRRAILSVPGQVDAILAWASRQPWADPRRVSLLGFSLGGFVVPAAQRLAQQRGAGVGWTVLGYAGAPIGDAIAGHPNAGPAWLRGILGASAELLLRPIEPSLHLPHLHGRFLVLGAADDRLIARSAARRYAELTPEPRIVVELGGNHMGVGPEKDKLLAQVIDVSQAWLVEHGAIEPASPTAARPPAPSLPSRRRTGTVDDPASSTPAHWRCTDRSRPRSGARQSYSRQPSRISPAGERGAPATPYSTSGSASSTRGSRRPWPSRRTSGKRRASASESAR